MSACRVLWALMYAGVKDVRLLDGGFKAWKNHGGETQKTPSKFLPAQVDKMNVSCKPKYLATTSEVSDIVTKK